MSGSAFLVFSNTKPEATCSLSVLVSKFTTLPWMFWGSFFVLTYVSNLRYLWILWAVYFQMHRPLVGWLCFSGLIKK